MNVTHSTRWFISDFCDLCIVLLVLRAKHFLKFFNSVSDQVQTRMVLQQPRLTCASKQLWPGFRCVLWFPHTTIMCVISSGVLRERRSTSSDLNLSDVCTQIIPRWYSEKSCMSRPVNCAKCDRCSQGPFNRKHTVKPKKQKANILTVRTSHTVLSHTTYPRVTDAS